MKKLILSSILIIACNYLSAQVAISYFPFQSVLSVSSNTERTLFFDYKLETNRFVSNLNMEFSPKLNFSKSDLVNYYVGPGVSFNPFNEYTNVPITNGYFLDFGLRAKPIDKYKSLQVVFEISPYVNRAFNGGNLRTRLGLAWNFTKK